MLVVDGKSRRYALVSVYGMVFLPSSTGNGKISGCSFILSVACYGLSGPLVCVQPREREGSGGSKGEGRGREVERGSGGGPITREARTDSRTSSCMYCTRVWCVPCSRASREGQDTLHIKHSIIRALYI